jgi:hypothetical protein
VRPAGVAAGAAEPHLDPVGGAGEGPEAEP